VSGRQWLGLGVGAGRALLLGSGATSSWGLGGELGCGGWRVRPRQVCVFESVRAEEWNTRYSGYAGRDSGFLLLLFVLVGCVGGGWAVLLEISIGMVSEPRVMSGGYRLGSAALWSSVVTRRCSVGAMDRSVARRSLRARHTFWY
jgi:hypothetical protein